MDFPTDKTLTQSTPIGKHPPDAIYLHVSALSAIPDELQALLSESIQNLQLQSFAYQVVKFAKRDFKLSLLSRNGAAMRIRTPTDANGIFWRIRWDIAVGRGHDGPCARS